MKNLFTLLVSILMLAFCVQADPIVLTAVVPHGHDDPVTHLAFLQGGDLLSASAGGKIKLWSMINNQPTERKITSLNDKDLKIVAYASDAKGRYLAAGFSNGCVKIIDLLFLQNDSPSFEVAKLMSGPGLKSLAFNHDGTYLASWSALEIFWWDLVSFTVVQNNAVPEVEIDLRLASVDYGMASLAFTPDNSLLVRSDRGVLVHDFKDGVWLAERLLEQNQNFGAWPSLGGRVAFSPDGTAVVIATGSTLEVYGTPRSSL